MEPHNHLVFCKYYFAAAKTSGHDDVGDATENNSTNHQTLVVVNQHIYLPEEAELMANAHSDAPKNMPKSIKSRPNNPVASTSKDVVRRCSACEQEYCDPPTEEWIECCKCQAWWHEECSNYENGILICDYC
ncbi:uncharacterized protein TNCV_3379311 [Trichonephila clavipes]|nr:uncharacterized protein TNCV_3379311 [Trichonephila clavipes]